MKRFFISSLIVLTALFAVGQQALVDNVDGQWLIYNKGTKHVLDPSFHDLGNFDELGLTYFLRHDNYGIVNEKGEVVLKETFKSAEQLGAGYYLFLDDKKRILGKSNGEKLEFREISRYSQVQDNWRYAQMDSVQLLFNTLGGKEWIFTPDDRIYGSGFNYVYCEIDDSVYLFDPNGNSLNMGEYRPVFDENYLLLQTSDEKKIIYESHEIPLPLSARNIRIRENEILYSEDGKSTIISALDGRVISTFPYEDISYDGNSTFTFREKGRSGLMTKEGKILVPAKYNSIAKVDDLYNVWTSNGAGVIDANGTELIPCTYSYVRVYSDFFGVYNDIDLTGLVSRKTQKTLLPCVYSSIMLSDTIIRAFASNMLRMLELDSNHRIVSDLVLSNVTSIVRTKASTDVPVDKRLFSLGWFLESVPSFDSYGYQTGESLLWGLKDAYDGLLRPAKNKAPVYVENADFSLLPKGRVEASLLGHPKNQWPLFEVTNFITGKSLVPENVISLDTTDLLTRNYSRFLSSKGYGILLGDNTILRVNYFDSHDPDYLRFCTSKKPIMLPAEDKDVDKVRMPDFDMNNDPQKFVQVKIDESSHEWVRYDKAEWNFLDKTGNVVFSEPFDFVEPYKFETALVMKDGRTGVVRADSIVIPVAYSEVKRSPISDTLFVVKKNSNVLRYLDTNGRSMPREFSRFFMNKGNLAQVEWNKQKVLVDPNYQVISGETKFQKMMDSDLFYSKENKLFTIYNLEGRQLGEVPLRPEEIWFEEYVLAVSRGKKGVLSVDGDTIVPFQYKKIEQIGNYIFAQDGLNNLLFNEKMEQIDNLKTSSVLVDSITGQYAEIKSNKAVIYSPEGKKLRSASGVKFEHFHNGNLIEMGNPLKVSGEEEEYMFNFNPKSIEVMGRNGYLVEDVSGVVHYFDPNWKEVTFDEPLTRVNYVGEGLALAFTRTGTLLFGGDVNVSLKVGTRNVKEFQSGFLLTRCLGKYEYLNTEGINEFNSTYDEAQPFHGNYATVKESTGWTIIDRNGNFQVLPNFDEITSESPTIFSTRAQPVYGLFDSHGNELISTEYQQLHFLRNGIIQGRKDGDIFYFEVNGTPILLE